MENRDLCEKLFAAFSSGDADGVRQLCTADLKASQNGGAPMNLDTLLHFTMAVLGVVKDFRYEDAIRSTTETGFVEEHNVRGTLPDGSKMELAVCVVGDVEGGKISRLREYVDSAAAAGLIAALS
ncbi:MAG: nuclear transport factor 2 family protein [Anaerolineae bacterium]